jgi:uncharacterized damage-inducible protein DinB
MTTEQGEVLARLRATLAELPALVARLPQDRIDRAPAPGEWSAAGVLAHLADAEQVYGVRLKLIVAADRPVITPYDQEDWERLYAPLETVKTSLERWTVLRNSTLRLLDSLRAEDWARVGLHEERGEESVARVVRMLVDHDQAHMAQMEAATR